jgi:hydroxyacylglutathione hydrolase
LDLSRKTNAPIVYGATAKPEFEAIVAEDNQVFELGNVKFKGVAHAQDTPWKVLAFC